MLRKTFILSSLVALTAAGAMAEPMRTRLTRENQFPGLGKAEASLQYYHQDYDSGVTVDRFELDGRYGVYENLTLRAGLPVVQSDLAGSSETGLGDLYIGAELLAFEDIFRYPFVIPHVDLMLPTGDDDKGLGRGETSLEAGVSVGTTIYDQLTFIADATYAFNGGFAQDSDDDVYFLSGAILWDVSTRFAVLLEGRIWEENEFNDSPYQYLAGMIYEFTDDLTMGVYGGQFREDAFGIETTADLALVRFGYEF